MNVSNINKKNYSFSHTEKCQGRLGKGYRSHFWFAMLDSLWQSLVIFFVAAKSYEDTDVGIWQFGATIVSSCLITMLCHFALEVRTWVSAKIAMLDTHQLAGESLFSGCFT